MQSDKKKQTNKQKTCKIFTGKTTMQGHLITVTAQSEVAITEYMNSTFISSVLPCSPTNSYISFMTKNVNSCCVERKVIVDCKPL